MNNKFRNSIVSIALCLMGLNAFSDHQDQGGYAHYRGSHHQSVSEQLICVHGPRGNDSAPARASDGQILGARYFLNEGDCYSAIQNSFDGVVCTAGVNSREAVPTQISTGKLLGSNYYATLEECKLAVSNKTDSLICTAGPNRGNSAIQNIETGVFLDANYRTSVEDCVYALSGGNPYRGNRGHYRENRGANGYPDYRANPGYNPRPQYAPPPPPPLYRPGSPDFRHDGRGHQSVQHSENRRSENRGPVCIGNGVFGSYGAGGGCGAFGCWYNGGGCGAFGCWYKGGQCGAMGCIKEAPKTTRACQ